jgi:hypothetical protein
MFKNINKISGVSSKIGNIARSIRSKTAIAAAVAGTTLGFASAGFAADITEVTTSLTTGTPTQTNHINGWTLGGTLNGEPFTSNTNYNVSYGSQDQRVTSVKVGSSVYNVSPTQGTTTFRTESGLPNVSSIWYVGGGTGGTSIPVPINGPDYTSNTAAFAANNFLLGADNVFSTAVPPNNSNDRGNISRIDVLFPGGITASAATAFAVFDRGLQGAHDPFGIAAITAESGGVPTAYAGLVTTYDTAGSWGNTNLLPSNETEDVLRSSNGGTMHPANQVVQNIGGVLIPTNTLVASGTTIYGYSLFSEAVTGSNNLVSYATLPQADDTVQGGLDPLATTNLLYTATVPEPTSAALLTVGAAGFLARRPKRKMA